jgi:hypothetical protein
MLPLLVRPLHLAPLSFSILLCLATFLVAPVGMALPDAEVGRDDPWLVFEGTESPDGRYAVAWGLPKHPEVWAEICRSFREQAQRKFEDDEKIAVPEDDVENYIVDLQEKKVLERLTSNHELVPNYWRLPHLSPNRHDLEVVWSRASDVVLVNHAFRWDSVTFCAVRVSNGKAGSVVDLHKGFGPALRNQMAKSFPRGAMFSKNDLALLFEDAEQLQGSKFSVHATAVNPAKGENSWSGDAVIHFTLTPLRESELTLKLLDLHKPRKKAGEVPGTEEHALAKAERHLNTAYSALRLRVDANAREALRQEEREWLEQREKIVDAFKRAEFVEARAQELEKRARRSAE